MGDERILYRTLGGRIQSTIPAQCHGCNVDKRAGVEGRYMPENLRETLL
jgi:hypothetical protein